MKFEIKGKPLKGMSEGAISVLDEIHTELRIIRALIEAKIKGLI